MKKLMTALAICATAGIVSATDPVTSANVVGYLTHAPDEIGDIVGAVQFVSVGDSHKTLNTLFDSSQLEFGDNMQLLADDLVSFVSYTWWGDHWENDGGQVVGTDVPDVSMVPGKGFMLVCSSVRQVIAAGQVSSSNVSTPILAGYNFIGSAFPVSFSPGKYDWSSAEFGDEIQIYDASTFGFKSLIWWGDHWEDDNGNTITDGAAAVGSGFYYISSSGGWNLVQTSPLAH